MNSVELILNGNKILDYFSKASEKLEAFFIFSRIFAAY